MEERTCDTPTMSSGTSDSDDDFNPPAFFHLFAKSKSTRTSAQTEKAPKLENSKLDALVSVHAVQIEELTRLEELKKEIQENLKHGSQSDSLSLSPHDVPEHTDVLHQYEIKASESHTLPGINLFHAEQCCCLYSETTTPFNCGFQSSGSGIDNVIASTVPGTLTNLLLSKALVRCFGQISDKESVMLWLLNILAVHQSPVAAHSCYQNMMGILHNCKVQSFGKDKERCFYWCPHPLSLLRIFVNLGADPKDLLSSHHPYSEEQINKYLGVEHNENARDRDLANGHLRKENVQLLLKVLGTALSNGICLSKYRPCLSKEDLSEILYMVAKLELDVAFDRSLRLEIQECISVILQSFSDNDWPAIVPSMCRQLHEVTDHHHNQFHLADLLPGTPRGNFLQRRLSYVYLRALFDSSPTKAVTDREILDFKLADIINLGQKGGSLVKALQSLLKRDLYEMMTAIKLLDLSVGDDLYRSTQPWVALEKLIQEINVITRSIRDNVNTVDLSKVKDSLSKLNVKWSLSLQVHKDSNQRSVLPWVSDTNEPVLQEVLKDNCSLLEDELDLDL